MQCSYSRRLLGADDTFKKYPNFTWVWYTVFHTRSTVELESSSNQLGDEQYMRLVLTTHKNTELDAYMYIFYSCLLGEACKYNHIV